MPQQDCITENMSACCIRVIGGLGNQLFMIATAFAYAKRFGKDLIVDDTKWFAGQGNHPNAYKSNIFKNFQFGPTPADHTVVREKRHNYDELPFVEGNVLLAGYFQSLKYFDDYKEEFISLLNTPQFAKQPGRVAFHIRRGDYVMKAHEHLTCKTNYFESQFERFDPKSVDVFTDSPDYVRSEFSHRDLNIVALESDTQELALMSGYDTIVCSNSSFSWWASMLGDTKKEIIVPDAWLHGCDFSDIYRQGMTIVKTKDV